MENRTVLLVAGDSSGDLHGSGLARELRRLRPGLRISAVGGPRLLGAADEPLLDLASLGLAGFSEPLRKIGRVLSALGLLRRYLAERRPSLVVPIDFYGFNKKVLDAAHRAGIPAVYFISPQVWASRPRRSDALARLVRRMICIFPFEESLYRKAGLPCSFVGHPLLDLVPPPSYASPHNGQLKIGLLPGSRAQEAAKLLPVFLGALRVIRRRFPRTDAVLFGSPALDDRFYSRWMDGEVRVVREEGYARRAELDLALTCSGTATLENALLGVPMVVAYRLSWPSYAVARALIRVPRIAMPNILAGRDLVPELVQSQATPRNIGQAALKLLERPLKLEATRRELAALRPLLGEPGAYVRAAELVLREIP